MSEDIGKCANVKKSRRHARKAFSQMKRKYQNKKVEVEKPLISIFSGIFDFLFSFILAYAPSQNHKRNHPIEDSHHTKKISKTRKSKSQKIIEVHQLNEIVQRSKNVNSDFYKVVPSSNMELSKVSIGSPMENLRDKNNVKRDRQIFKFQNNCPVYLVTEGDKFSCLCI